MEVFKIDITSWTASFRYPNLISGFQPTLEVPPISTVLGLINAAAGRYLTHQQLTIGYYFEFGGKAVDLETIYQISGNKGRPSNQGKSNIMRREFLFDNSLRLYLTDASLANFFSAPYYPLVIGRMNDLASIHGKVEKMKLLSLPKAEKVRGQLIPFRKYHLPGEIQALPKYFTNTFPRNNLGTEPYSVLSYQNQARGDFEVFRDEEKEVDIYFHKLSF